MEWLRSQPGLMRFGSAAPWNCKCDGLRHPQTFDFLGFTHYVHRSRLLYKWLNRRSQRRSTDWARFRTTLHSRWLPPLRIRHNLYPDPLWKTQAGSRTV